MSVISDPSEEALIGLNRLATVARLLSGAIHDVNNALQVISSTVEIVLSRVAPPAPWVTEKYAGDNSASCVRTVRSFSTPSGVRGGKNSKLNCRSLSAMRPERSPRGDTA